MKTYKLIIMLFISLSIGSCIKKELILPNAPMEEEKEAIDLIAKPIDVKFVGDYDYGFKIKWPDFSEKISKVIVNYVESDGNDVSMEITDFKKDHIFATNDFKEYAFELVAYDSQGNASKRAIIKSTNKNIYAIQVLSEARVVQNGAYIRLQWNNELQRKLNVSVKNVAGEKELVSEEKLGILDMPIIVDNTGVNVQFADQTSGVSSNKSFPLTVQGGDFPASFKGNWTIFYDSPYNNAGWWHVGEAFDGIYNFGPDLGGTPKLNAVQINGVKKLNSDLRIRTVYFTFTQKSNNINPSDSQYDPRMINPPGPYDNLLIQELRYVFKAPQNYSVFPAQVRVYGKKLDGSEVLIENITNTSGRLVELRSTDPDYVKGLIITVPQTSMESANYIGIKTEIISESVPGNTNSDDWRNIIGLGEIYVKGVRTGL